MRMSRQTVALGGLVSLEIGGQAESGELLAPNFLLRVGNELIQVTPQEARRLSSQLSAAIKYVDEFAERNGA